MEEKREIDNFIVLDPDSGEECWVGVRSVGGRVLLAISRQFDGDVEISLAGDDAKRLAKALTDK